MEISEKELRALVRDVDDAHRAGMEHAEDDIRELHFGEGARVMGTARRTFLQRAGITGATVAVGSALLPISGLIASAGAQSLDDGDIAAFAESVELAAVQAYTLAAQSGKVTTKAVLDAATTFAGHHKEHAGAFGGAAGSKATGKANAALLAALGPQLSAAADEKAVIEFAYGLENAAAATYLFAIGALTSSAALALTASILPVEAQHAIVLGSVNGKTLADMIPKFETKDLALDPTKYPTK